MSQVCFTRKIHMIRCSSRIFFESSCFNRRSKSPLNLQRLTEGSFILRTLFRNLQLRERLQFLQLRERVVQIKEYLILQDYLNLNLEDESLGEQPPSEFEVNMITSLKQGILEINEHSVNSDSKRRRSRTSIASGPQTTRMVSRRSSGILREWSQGSYQEGAHLIEQCRSWSIWSNASQSAIKRRSGQDQAKIIESRWVIGPRSGQLKARFVGKGYTQIIDKESKYAHTPQATTLKIILLMSQIHKWSLCVSDVASAFLNTPIE